MPSAPYAPSAALHMAQQAAYRAPAPIAVSNAPPGTFTHGTKVQVGSHRVTIEKYLSEGGFAHVYLVRVPKSDGRASETAVLKRVAVPDKDALANMRTEVETMKKLKGHSKIVVYMDSHASQLKGGGYEVFLLMEYCSGGGLIDFMNTRLQHRLTEPEILHIFSDVAEGVATMHYLKPPLLHRDLKVENVLITTVSNNKIYKLCDFGSTAPPRPAATTAAEGRLIEDDVQRHTTLQYRSPEMIDVYRKQPIDEKSDIWALGVLLYKLCYYTTPFEEVGQMAILNATFKYPSYPQFSDRLKKLIGWMLRESPQHRPNIYQVVAEVCSMRHRAVPIKDIYSGRTESEARRNQQLPPTEPQVSSPPIIGLQKVAPVKQVQQIPEITPMRRGRPTGPAQTPAAKPSPSPMRGTSSDPFAALDSQDVQVRRAAADELAARFPSLDEFSLLHDRGQKFEFGQMPSPSDPVLTKRVTDALADDAFALSPATKVESAPTPKPSSKLPSASVSRSTSVKQPRSYEPKDSPRTSNPTIQQPIPQHVNMVSTGVQTSPRSSPAPPQQKFPDVNKPPVWKVPISSHHNRAYSQPRALEKAQGSPSLKPEFALPARPSLDSRSKSQLSNLSIPKSPASSRPSLESQRPSALDLGYTIDRSKSANSNARPVSMHVASNLDYLRDREMAPGRSFDAPSLQRRLTSTAIDDSEPEPEEKNIRSSVDFLRTIEKEDPSHKHNHRRSSSQSKNAKRGSITNIVKGRFGDAFRRFETNKTPEHERDPPPFSPTDVDPRGTNALTPIAGSEATGGLSDDDRSAIDETQELSPELRRELEKRKLEDEERRVEAAAAEYKQRVAQQGQGKPKVGPSKASTIQNRVKNLLDESKKPVPGSKTAEGYGKYTDTGKPLPTRPQDQSGMRQAPAIARKPVNVSSTPQQQDLLYAKPSSIRPNMPPPIPSSSAPPTINPRNPSGPPPRAPKPKALQTGGSAVSVSGSPIKASPVVKDKPLPAIAPGEGSTASGEDWDMETFSKRYPSLSGLEMVETEIPRGRVRDV
ncbi:Ark1/Prk1 family protein kinase Ppk30 [Cucurbitaria berberidis CBS 394.84]|uniref:non-specific serine/threonine protein kinase n=1 Tax=Cucurbitaria berberidis CBS 394.84 TaxID=1168544 RepID=A0A9P4GCA8_9PLEO|nr:Ark1/Prk1 family protein kinase Ppk30 [Cucurbitaria berberidis CBS 394.84]KAF1843002.1 Ark1/Prk1 family protein kinase Ppk30 [Cucurbitaria berberidis CBS 394.84]